VRLRASRRDFPILDRIPARAKLVGVFGFLNNYKGLNTAIRALRHLPEDHHLLIFGAIHPNEIAAGRPIHPHLASVFDEAYVDATPYDQISTGRSDGSVRLTVEADRGLAALIGPHPRDVSARIHFMGAATDDDFLCGMASCDVVVFPYLEVGQSSSGPISQALETRLPHHCLAHPHIPRLCRLSPWGGRVLRYRQLLELAERIRARRQFPPRDGLPAYNIETNKAVYLAANGRAPGAGAEAVAEAGAVSETAATGQPQPD